MTFGPSVAVILRKLSLGVAFIVGATADKITNTGKVTVVMFGLVICGVFCILHPSAPKH
jgi:hypothetical protein